MYLLFALSILFNLIAGISVAYSLLDERFGIRSYFAPEGFTDPRFRLVFGILTFVVGFLKLIFVVPGSVVVLGDFLPALTGMLLGFILVLFFYLDRATIKSDGVQRLESLFIGNAGIFGVGGIVVTILHLLFSRAVFL